MSLNYFQARVQSGKINEEFYKPLIEKDIKEELNSNNEYNLFDFENDNFKVELKTREVQKQNIKQQLLDTIKLKKV